jgi:hypothetical protein
MNDFILSHTDQFPILALGFKNKNPGSKAGGFHLAIRAP